MLIRDWNELANIPNESETHILEVDVDNCCGYLYAKYPQQYNFELNYMDQLPHLDFYLSTHTFYGSKYKFSTQLLKACGFDVEIDNWDKQQE